MDHDDPPAFSRSGNTHPQGKSTAEVKVRLPEEMRDHLSALAVLEGKSLSEYLRDQITRLLYGELQAVRMRAGRQNGSD